MRLPADQRASLAARLIASLDQAPAEPHAESLWAAEARRRAEELAGGKVEAVPAERAFANARSRLR